MKKISGILVMLFLAVIFLSSCSCGEAEYYTVTWKNRDGTVLEIDENVEEGTYPVYDGEEPTKENEEHYTYSFNGWSPAVTYVEEDVTYIAQFKKTPIEYTITWKNWDGTVLETNEQAAYDSIPQYKGATPTKEGYTFDGWEPAISKVVGNATYTAKFKVKEDGGGGGGGDEGGTESLETEFVFADLGDGYTVVHYLGNANKVSIPEYYMEKPVISIDRWAFNSNKTTTKLIVPNSIQEIKKDAICNCSALKTVTLGNGIKTIGANAFGICPLLETINLPEGLTYIGDEAFRECPKLRSMSLPNSIESFGKAMFKGYDNMEYTTYEGGKYLGNNGNPYLVLVGMSSSWNTSITIHNKCKLIANGAFEKINFTELNFGTGVKIIGKLAFSQCKGLTEITFPDSLIKIDDNAFSQSSITKVTFGNNLRYIGNNAFERSRSLVSVSIPNSIEYMGIYAFYQHDNLATTEYNNAKYLGNGENPYLVLLKAKNTSINNIEIHENTKIIAGFAFEGCSSLTTITIPKNVKYIGRSAFQACNGLNRIIVDEDNTVYAAPNESAIIEKLTSRLAFGFNETIIPNGVEIIGAHAFYNNTQITAITIPEGVKTIEDSAFLACTNLERVTLANSITYIGNSAFAECLNLGAIRLPNNLKVIEESAFYRNRLVTEVVIPNTTTYIGDNAFYYCGMLRNLTLGNSVVVIGKDAFKGCSTLFHIVIPDNVQSIKYDAFGECTGTLTITIGSGVRFMQKPGFSACNNATALTVDSENQVFDSRENCNAIIETATNTLLYGIKISTIPADIEAIGDEAFNGSQITTLELSGNVKSIGRNAFYNTWLTSVTLEEGLVSIGEYAFGRCLWLGQIVIPRSVTTIDHYAFDSSTSLNIYAKATDKPAGWEYWWNSSNLPVYWYSETPNYDGNHWRYVTGAPTIWVSE